MSETRFALTSQEMNLVQNQEWLLSKHRIISKVYELFGGLSDEYRSLTKMVRGLPEETLIQSPKIYRGEQYRQLPYVMMDYPRHFQKEDTLAIRSMFWWGHYFSIQFVSSGKYKAQFARKLAGRLSGSDWYLGVNIDPWQHHFESSNYQPIDKASLKTVLKQPYFKVAAMHSLKEWASAKRFFVQEYTALLGACSS